MEKVLYCRVSEETHELVKNHAGNQGINNFVEQAIHSYIGKDKRLVQPIIDAINKTEAEKALRFYSK
jgi:hypothetical protein